jgi:hypothetical protein
MGTNCAGCGDPVPVPVGTLVDVWLLDDGRHQWALPHFYGAVIHCCTTVAV